MVDRVYIDRLSEITEKLFRVERLSSIPYVLSQLMTAVGDQRTDAAQLEKIIESDPGLASKVLSLANSAFYGFSQRITTIKRAVVAMGYRDLQLLALGTGLTNVFDPAKAPPNFDANALWMHSLSVSWLARELAEKAGYDSPGEILVAGLLHDLGKLAISTHLPEEMIRIIEQVDKGTPYYRAEEDSGIPHTLLGYMLGKKWGLPDIHLAAIRYHHNPSADSFWPISTCLVSLSDAMVKSLGIGLAHQSRPIDKGYIIKQIKLEETAIEEVLEKAGKTLPELISGWQEGILDGQQT